MSERLPKLKAVVATKDNLGLVVLDFGDTFPEKYLQELREHIQTKFDGQLRLLPGALLTPPAEPSDK